MSQKGVVPKSIQVLHITLAININRPLLRASTGKVLVSRANFSRRLKTSRSSPATWPKVTCGVKEGEEKCVLLGGRKGGAFVSICIYHIRKWLESRIFRNVWSVFYSLQMDANELRLGCLLLRNQGFQVIVSNILGSPKRTKHHCWGTKKKITISSHVFGCS